MHLPRIVLAWTLLVACSDSSPEEKTAPPSEPVRSELKVMSFNIWKSGHRGLDATVEAIQRSGADIIGLQECDATTARTIADRLGANEVHDENHHAIVTRFP